MGTRKNRLSEAVLTSTHNLCFEQKYEKYQNFYPKIWKRLVLAVKFSIYLNRRVFVMYCSFWWVFFGTVITVEKEGAGYIFFLFFFSFMARVLSVVVCLLFLEVSFVGCVLWVWLFLTKTCLDNFDPPPHTFNTPENRSTCTPTAYY